MNVLSTFKVQLATALLALALCATDATAMHPNSSSFSSSATASSGQATNTPALPTTTDGLYDDNKETKIEVPSSNATQPTGIITTQAINTASSTSTPPANAMRVAATWDWDDGESDATAWDDNESGQNVEKNESKQSKSTAEIQEAWRLDAIQKARRYAAGTYNEERRQRRNEAAQQIEAAIRKAASLSSSSSQSASSTSSAASSSSIPSSAPAASSSSTSSTFPSAAGTPTTAECKASTGDKEMNPNGQAAAAQRPLNCRSLHPKKATRAMSVESKTSASVSLQTNLVRRNALYKLLYGELDPMPPELIAIILDYETNKLEGVKIYNNDRTLLS